jgi:hypothetical protein
MTKGGEHVHRLAKGIYRIIDTDAMLRSDDPDAC